MWIRSRLSLFFFAVFVIYSLVAVGVIGLLHSYEQRKQTVYDLNRARYILSESAKREDSHPIEELLFLANTGVGFQGETRDLLLNYARSASSGNGEEERALRTNLSNRLAEEALVLEKRLARFAVTWPSIAGLFILVVGLLTLISLYSVNQSILNPVRALVEATQALGKGNLDVSLPAGGRDEIGLLVSAIETMRMDLKAMVGQLEETHKTMKEKEKMAALGEVCAAVAHSIRNPLAAIRSSAQLERRRHDSPSLDTIIEEVDALTLRLRSLLTFVRPGMDGGGAASAARSAERVVRSLQEAFRDAGLHFTVQVPEEIIAMDPSLLEHILMTVLENACEASGTDGKIMLTGTVNGGFMHLTVADEGCGMSEETLQRLFQPFKSTKPDGAGLGLSLARRILDSHGGRIEVESREGQGTDVTLVLPSKEDHEPSIDC